MTDGDDVVDDAEPGPAGTTPWWFWVAATVAIAGLAVGIILARTAAPPAPDSSTIDARPAACDVTWPDPASGRNTFEVANHTGRIIGVEMLDLPGLRVRADLEMLAPGTHRPLVATVGRGRYKFRCEVRNGAVIESPAFTVTGRPLPATNSFRPASSLALLSAVTALHASTVDGVAQLEADTDGLARSVDAGSLASAQQQWLVAHLDYARLGAAYGTFGDLDAAIDGRPDGLRLGVDDPAWTGFGPLERALWSGQPIAVVRPIVDRLDADVHALAARIAGAATDPTELTIRVHEILENALQFELTGQTDHGSHTNLATTRADVDATRTALAAVTPLLEANDPKLLAAATAALDRCSARLEALRRPDGSWPDVATLPRAQRQALNGTVSQAVEDLSPIPDVLELTPGASND